MNFEIVSFLGYYLHFIFRERQSLINLYALLLGDLMRMNMIHSAGLPGVMKMAPATWCVLS